MSAFAVIYERSNTSLEPDVLDRPMARLSHRGPDGSDVSLLDHVHLGHWHFWITPEEVGEKQPISLSGFPFTMVFDGRIDNRSELIKALALPSNADQSSDAVLILRAYDHWGERCFEHFIGEFAVVIFDHHRKELICARDALGDRTLFYSISANRVSIASEAWAVAGAADRTPALDEVGVAHYFALKAPDDGRTLFQDIRELMPAEVLSINDSGERRRRYWQADLSAEIRYHSDDEYAEHFRSILEESVRCRMRSITPVGVMMSGGLDSTSVACFAARMIAPQQLTTISYVFDELKECDERSYIETMQKHYNLRSIQILADDAWPFKDVPLPENLNYPQANPFRLLIERTYQCAHQAGVRMVLTGGFADHMYYGSGVAWLADLLRDGQWFAAYREVFDYISNVGFSKFWRAGFAQSAGKRFLNSRVGLKNTRSQRNFSLPAWLTPYASDLLRGNRDGLLPMVGANISMLSIKIAHGQALESYFASRNHIDVRSPYRDRRLLEFVLAIPAYQLFQRGLYKHILRNAMRGVLPESIRARKTSTFFTPLFFRGFDREKNFLQTSLQSSEAGWNRFVRPDWVMRFVQSPQKGSGMDVPWFCIAYETWYKSYLTHR